MLMYVLKYLGRSVLMSAIYFEMYLKLGWIIRIELIEE